MATVGRLRELAKADMDRECAMFEELSSPVLIRQATQDELNKYRNIKTEKNERLKRELNYRKDK